MNVYVSRVLANSGVKYAGIQYMDTDRGKLASLVYIGKGLMSYASTVISHSPASMVP